MRARAASRCSPHRRRPSPVCAGRRISRRGRAPETKTHAVVHLHPLARWHPGGKVTTSDFLSLGPLYSLANSRRAMADTMPKEADERAERTRWLLNALSGEDDLGMVVRAHIVIEHELEEFVRFAAPRPSQVKFSEMDYDAKVRLALVLGLDENLKPALNAAGSLRNKFSHRLEMKLGEQEVKNLFATLTSDYLKELRPVVTEMLMKKSQKRQELSAKSRVQIFFVLIFTAVLAHRRLLKEGRL
jgi:hypothetical protein